MRVGDSWLIGDPHFGRDFSNGRPINRRGDREAMQRRQFIEELHTPDVSTIVMVGDLFDKPVVPLLVLSQVMGDVLDAALARPDVTWIMMAGNHDRSRQLTCQSAWDIFAMTMRQTDNVIIVEEPTVIDEIAYFPWEWGVSAIEQVHKIKGHMFHTAIGHWDMKSFGGDDSHLVPVTPLLQVNPSLSLYSGHYHEEKIYQVEGANITCTGSLQPYAHGEGDMYVTLGLEEALQLGDTLRDSCVRVILQPGEVLPDIDCLQLTALRSSDEQEEIDLGAVGSEVFDVMSYLDEEMASAELAEDVVIYIRERLGAID